ncbi:MAG: flagellar export protein FliJ [Alphaproteobacteria bacterium]|nr:flagellar export protein FliJ [Alphaproteobacteria bacterium]MDE1967374.1 flagellar export protein FliJ [Alphaproteobacteria bacterium]MDE2513137.1 flagellar export protein FliJ [Alphaproteobacteria bacterium]
MALHAMGKLAERQVEEAQRRWAVLAKECAAARRKLNLLRQYGDSYRAQLEDGGRQGVVASQAASVAAFIRRVADVVAREEAQVRQLEGACEREWADLVVARRNKRMIEILVERQMLREAEEALRRSQSEIDDLIARAGIFTRESRA